MLSNKYIKNKTIKIWGATIALIPKVNNPSRVNQFRPISLTNFNYKIISKILSNRLKPLLHKIISPLQSAFFRGRSIHDNTILGHFIP
jgi:hypothetical protein